MSNKGRPTREEKKDRDTWGLILLNVHEIKNRLNSEGVDYATLSNESGMGISQIEHSLSESFNNNSMTIESAEWLNKRVGLDVNKMLPGYKEFLNHARRKPIEELKEIVDDFADEIEQNASDSQSYDIERLVKSIVADIMVQQALQNIKIVGQLLGVHLEGEDDNEL